MKRLESMNESSVSSSEEENVSPSSSEDEDDNNITVETVLPTVSSGVKYKMDCGKPGIAIILNHLSGDCNKDQERIQKVFENIGFEVKLPKSDTKTDALNLLREVSKMDHAKHNCLVVFVLAYGEEQIIRARDTHYSVDELWKNFVGNVCPSLVDKPKLFFLQATRNSDVMDKISKEKPFLFVLPTMVDILAMYSIHKVSSDGVDGDDNGSLFIQVLCDELEKNVYNYELLSLLTSVSRSVVDAYKSKNPTDVNMENIKETPCIISRLTKSVHFIEKKNV